MSEIRTTDLGQTWLALLRAVCRDGQDVGGETRELCGVCVAFEQAGSGDGRLARFIAGQPVEEMRRVFFSTGPNQFAHSYADKLRGPGGRSDLSDVVELLAREPLSKRAAVTLVGDGDGKVPCINVVHFLRRGDGLLVNYFARGQDIFRKFYADCTCVHEMGRRVADALGVGVTQVAGMVSSAHIYLADMPEVQAMLAEVDALPSPQAARAEGSRP
jgi:thymidylate synthase